MFARLRTLLWPADRSRRFLSVLLLLVICQQVLIVLIFPPFSGHDEVAHFDYARLLAQEQRLPLIPELDEWRTSTESGLTPEGDFISPDLYAYCLFTLEWWPCEPDNPDLAANPPYEAVSDTDGLRYPIAWQYAANHPPLFYVLAAPVQKLIDGQGLGLQIRILRLLAIPFALLLVAGTFALARQVVPGSAFLPAAAASFIAFQPQIAFSGAIFNNDVTVIATGAWLLALLLYGMRRGFSRRVVVGFGVLLGVGMLFKGTAIIFAPVIAIGMVLGIGWRNVREWAPKGAAVAAIGFGIAAPWNLLLYRRYGSFDALDQVERLQALWNYLDGAPSFLELLTDGGFVSRFWRELWSGFGWRRIPFEDELLTLIGLVCLVCVAGLATMVVRNLRSDPSGSVASARAIERNQFVVLLSTVVIGYLAVIQFGTTFMLAQARYAFPVMPAVAVLLSAGLRALVPERWRSAALVVWVALLLSLSIYIYSAYVIPYWYLGEPR